MKQKKKRDWRNSIGMLFFLVIGGGCGYIIGQYITEMLSEVNGIRDTLLSIVFLIFGMYVMIFGQILIHEAGHLVFGLLSGYRFSMFRIGSLTFMRDPKTDKVRIRHMKLAGTGGQCLLVPPEPVDGKIPFVLYHLGGALMNLIAAAVFYVLYILTRPVPPLSLVFLIGVIVGAAYAMMNGVPMRLGAVDNDGYNLYAQLQHPAATEAMRIQLLTAEASAAGVRLRDMPAAWFEVPAGGSAENSMVAVIRVLACNRLMDEGQYERTEAAIRSLLQEKTGIVGIHRSLLLCDRATCLLLLGQTETANTLRTKVLTDFWKAMKTNPSVLRCQYAFAVLAERNPAEAAAIRKTFDACAAKHPYPADITSEREILSAIDAAAETTE